VPGRGESDGPEGKLKNSRENAPILFVLMSTVLLVFQYNYQMCLSSKSLSVSENNYMKVWKKGPIRRRLKGFGDGLQSSAIFTMFFKITHLWRILV